LPEVRDSGTTENGYLDLLPPEPPESTGFIQDLMLTGVVPHIYERWWRPTLGQVFKGPLGPTMADEHRIARLLMGLSPGDGVLDVACGNGNFSRGFAKTVGEDGLVVGLDVSHTMLERAVADTPSREVAYVRGDIAAPIFREHSFDAVCCFAAFHLLADPMAALDRMTGLLAPGGRIALFTTARPRSAPLRTFQSIATARSGAVMFDQGEVAAALSERGYTEVRVRVAGVTQFVGGRLALAT
jgi:ubiquinone/menaquinone biosynthesis C-methylase UbiE